MSVRTHTIYIPFNGPFSGTTRVSRYQKGKTDLDFTEARDSEWQWHQLGHMQVCTSPQTDNHANTPPLSFFTGRMPFLPPNRQRQSTEGKVGWLVRYLDIYLFYVCECWQCAVNWLQVFDEAVRAVLSPQATVRPMRKCCML